MKTPANNKITNPRVIVNIALAAIILASFNLCGAEDDHSKCEKNLLKVWVAIEKYRKDHNDLPNWLSDLVPGYLADTNLLICPLSAESGQKPPGVKDPKVSNAYHYEFNPLRIGADVQSFWGETQITMRE